MGKKRIITKGETDTPKDGTPSTPSRSRKSSKKNIPNGIIRIRISYNNTLISATDLQGNVIAWSSSGLLGFRGTKKSTPYAANLVARDCVEKAKQSNLTNVRIVVSGVGPARESATRSVMGSGLNVLSIMDKTSIPHNGVKPKKPRRV